MVKGQPGGGASSPPGLVPRYPGSMRFQKWHGIGNAYLVVEHGDLVLDLTPARVQRICHPDLGAGSDGILVIGADDDPRRVQILNPDGSEAEFSGNGTRIAAGYLMARDGAQRVQMTTLKGRILGMRHGGEITIDAGSATLQSGADHRPGVGPPPAERYTFVSVGNPHCVIEVDDPDSLDLVAAGAPIERHPWFPGSAPMSSSTVRWPSTRSACGCGARRRRDAFLGVGIDRCGGGGCGGREGPLPSNGAPGWRPAGGRGLGGARGHSHRPGGAGSRRCLLVVVRLDIGAALMRLASRVSRLPPYLFAELERKIGEKRAAGVDVISLGIGDPDTSTYEGVVEEAQRQVARPDTHQYPSNRGRPAFREAIAEFYLAPVRGASRP